jgi:hypothetical protein
MKGTQAGQNMSFQLPRGLRSWGCLFETVQLYPFDSVFSLLLSDLDYEDKWEEAPSDIEEQMQADDSITRNEKGEMVLRMVSCITVANNKCGLTLVHASVQCSVLIVHAQIDDLCYYAGGLDGCERSGAERVLSSLAFFCP